MKTQVLLFLFAVMLLFQGCNNKQNGNNELSESTKDTIVSYRDKGKITAVTHYNSANYFIYKGKPMGFHYEMLKELTDFLGIPLEVKIEDDLNENFRSLQNNDIDLIATNLTITKPRKDVVDFTVPHSRVKQVLVQRMPHGWKQMNRKQREEQLIRNVVDLGGKRVYVQKNSSFVTRLENLSEEIGDTIYIVEVDEEAEELISLVANGDINYTVCDENLAKANTGFYSNIDVQTPVSFDQNLAWAVKKGNEQLQNDINEWLIQFKRTKKYHVLYHKYFESSYVQNLRKSDYYTFNTGKMSQFDKYIQAYSDEIGWDWRLLASMIYQESRFKANVKSWAGAYGLMQLMPATGKQFGVDSTSAPGEQIRAGVNFIKWLNDRFENIENEEERIKFILAAYNVGLGHVVDAQRLAEKNGKNPKVWDDNVDYYLLSKSKPEYYKDPDVKYGYCRGIEPYNYVKEVLERYNHYQNLETN
ncbi:MAG: transporter substrate-binding domain-containing protein [Bacteroidetes bacterium]|jgi:membrane-bound lytic murein transglycosylase F|nr:transporter substrate-binding domain-containing protein [Bacteroidota bacterium]